MPDPETFIDPNLTRQDLLVLRSLLRDADGQEQISTAQSDEKGFRAGLNSEEEPFGEDVHSELAFVRFERN